MGNDDPGQHPATEVVPRLQALRELVRASRERVESPPPTMDDLRLPQASLLPEFMRVELLEPLGVVEPLEPLRVVVVGTESDPATDAEIDQRSKPDPLPRAPFWKAVGLLADGSKLADVERATGFSHRQVGKIRDWQAHPNELGPNGRPGYVLNPGPTPSTVLLRKLRKRRSH